MAKNRKLENATFKFFVEKNSESFSEVRKINLDLDCDENFEPKISLESLRKTIVELLSSLSSENDANDDVDDVDPLTEKYLLLYLDSEGDRVTIKTNSELKTYFLDQV